MKTQSKIIATAITAALLAGVAYAAENAGGGQPTSTPTHTVPAKPADQLTIKTKSSPPYAPPTEDQKVTPATGANASESAGKLPKGVATGTINIGGNPGNTWDPVNKCYVGKPPANYRCPAGQKIVDLDPSPKWCWRCEIPKD
jgi:hypothetical protein